MAWARIRMADAAKGKGKELKEERPDIWGKELRERVG